MSISFNHPANSVTSTGQLTLTVSGGSTTAPQPIRLNATSVIMPVRSLPSGEAGSMVFDTASRILKYHNGTSWVSIEASDVILAPIITQINNINTRLGTKVDTVTYSSSSVPSANISGTTLNIVFPLPGGGGSTGPTGLFTSARPGAIMQYSLSSGQTVAGIRTQLSGSSSGQTGRNGTQAAPWLSADGWCLGDGMWWTWEGSSGTVTKVVPNLNRGVYFKSINISAGGVTRTDNIFSSSATISATALSIAQLPPHSFSISGVTSSDGDHNHTAPVERASDGIAGAQTIRGVAWSGNPQRNMTNAGTSTNGLHAHTFTGTSNTIGSGQSHVHAASNIEVDRFEVAYLYNIAEPTYALSETVANTRYVLKTGDTMTGALTVASSVSVRGADTNLGFFFRNTANAERAAILHNSGNNTLRLRSAGGTEVQITNAGGIVASSISGTSLSISTNTATVNSKNIVRSVNGNNADAAGNVTVSLGNQAYLSTNGWFKDESTGMITQWGFANSTVRGYITATFPIAFPTACLNVSVTVHRNSSDDEAASNYSVVSSFNTTSAVIGCDRQGTYWTAIGY